MLPAWLRMQRPPGLTVSYDDVALVSPAQRFLTLFGMVFFSLAAIVRAPLHFALQAVTFGITIGLHGITAHLPLRLCVAACNLAIVVLLERAWRRRFVAAWRGKDARALGAGAGKME
jgi:hypothetical protein